MKGEYDMGKVIETILDMVFLIISTICLINIVGANNDSIAANNYLTNAQEIISASNINPDVIANCKTDASSQGYLLDVAVFNEDSYTSRYAVITLNYDYKIAMFQINTPHTKTAIAR